MWTANLPTQRGLALGMFGCICWAFADMTLSMGLAWPNAVATSLLAFLVFAAGLTLGGRETGRAYRKYTDYSLSDWALLLIPIVLVLKLLPYLLRGPAAVSTEMESWLTEPQRFWDVALVWSLLLIFFVWDYSVRIAEQFGRLSFQPAETLPPPPAAAQALPPAEIEGIYAWSMPAAVPGEATIRAFRAWDRSPYRFVSHAKAWEQLMWSFVAGGFFVLIFAGLALVSPEELGDPRRVEVRGVIPSVLLYYVLGLVLASQTSLDRLRAEWLRAGAEVQPGLARRWLGYGMTLMAVAVVLALILPTSFIDPDAGLSAGGGVIGFITAPLRLVLGTFFGALSWLLAHLAAFLFAPIAGLVPRGPTSDAPAAPPPAMPPDASTSDAYPSPVSQVLWGFLFYVVPAALAAYAIWNTWQKRRGLWRGVREFWRELVAMVWGAVLDVAAVLWRFFGAVSPGLLARAPEHIRQRWKARRAAAGIERPGWLRLRGLSPRDLIQYFYVSLVQRAAAVGWGRTPGQTPYEFGRELASRLPERAGEVDALTEAFVNAKYSRREVAAEEARRARRPWERLRGDLQVRRRASRVAAWFGLTQDR
jgi:hypothetical protein